jgi:hypothetical protein
MTTQEAIDEIVGFETLPPQIDYRLPFKIKADKAEEFLKALPKEESEKAFAEIEERVNNYFDSEVSYLDTLF